MESLNLAIETANNYNIWLAKNFSEYNNTNPFQKEYLDDIYNIHTDVEDDFIIEEEQPLYIPYEHVVYYIDEELDNDYYEVINDWIMD